jgi:hypothetical protein
MKCRIRVKGHLDVSWQEWFEGLQILHEEGGTTLFSGSLQDQAALYGVLLKMRQLGLSLLWFDSDDSSGPEARP